MANKMINKKNREEIFTLIQLISTQIFKLLQISNAVLLKWTMTSLVFLGIGFADAVPSKGQEPMFPVSSFGKLPMQIPQIAIGGIDAFRQIAECSRKFGDPCLLQRVDSVSEFAPYELINHSRRIGLLQIKLSSAKGKIGVATCTAALLMNDAIITNAHCIPGISGEVQDAEFWLNYVDEGKSERAHKIKLNLSNIIYDQEIDYSIIRLRGSVRGDLDKFIIRDPVDDETLYIIQHPMGQGKYISADRCSVRSVSQNVFTHTCDTFEGSSGSLIFARTDHALVGIHRGAIPGSNSNIGIRISTIFRKQPLLQKLVELSINPQYFDRTGDPFNLWRYSVDRLFAAIRSGDTKTVKLHLEKGIDSSNAHGNAAEVAVRSLQVEVLGMLLQHQVNMSGEVRKRILEQSVKETNEGDNIREQKEILDLLFSYNIEAYNDRGFPIVCDSNREFVRRMYAKYNGGFPKC